MTGLYYNRCVKQRLLLRKKQIKKFVQKLSGLMLILFSAVMIVVVFKDGGGDITSALLFMPMGIYIFCTKRNLLS